MKTKDEILKESINQRLDRLIIPVIFLNVIRAPKELGAKIISDLLDEFFTLSELIEVQAEIKKECGEKSNFRKLVLDCIENKLLKD